MAAARVVAVGCEVGDEVEVDVRYGMAMYDAEFANRDTDAEGPEDRRKD